MLFLSPQFQLVFFKEIYAKPSFCRYTILDWSKYKRMATCRAIPLRIFIEFRSLSVKKDDLSNNNISSCPWRWDRSRREDEKKKKGNLMYARKNSSLHGERK